MKSLNDLIWNNETALDDENLLSTQSIHNTMEEFCMTAFCNGVASDIAGNAAACKADTAYRTDTCYNN